MSCNSRKSHGENRGRGCHGFSSKCHCDLDVVLYTSNTQDHLFKWVEESVYEEVVDALPKISIIDKEIEDLKAQIEELKEDGMWNKRET
ncbi:PREDICTED: uncharacterized protein At1g43920, Chloroplastic-like [Camelina sativa]|uniref:Uncharacterized protein At1g43920, Chloroplastic-like n=1 Tax=Camelina sativa TaxID=90675 RepID=A0ABM1Q7I9_CAMSA|nr:PREDICTED: uncharacterized protein At1g43920, Chloroplastic-like [Camelina sativa]